MKPYLTASLQLLHDSIPAWLKIRLDPNPPHLPHIGVVQSCNLACVARDYKGEQLGVQCQFVPREYASGVRAASLRQEYEGVCGEITQLVSEGCASPAPFSRLSVLIL